MKRPRQRGGHEDSQMIALAVSLPSVGTLEPEGVLFSLLPGLLVYLVQHAISTRESQIRATEAVVWGLGYTLVTHAVWEVFKRAGSLVPTPDIVGLSITAVALGVALAWAQARGVFRSVLSRLGLGKPADYPSTWLSAMRRFADPKDPMFGHHAVIKLRSGERVYGGVVAYSELPDGHIVLDNYRWLTKANESMSTTTDGWLIVPIGEVLLVELVPKRRGRVVQLQTSLGDSDE